MRKAATGSESAGGKELSLECERCSETLALTKEEMKGSTKTTENKRGKEKGNEMSFRSHN